MARRTQDKAGPAQPRPSKYASDSLWALLSSGRQARISNVLVKTVRLYLGHTIQILQTNLTLLRAFEKHGSRQ
jgi:hypothetical protein